MLEMHRHVDVDRLSLQLRANLVFICLPDDVLLSMALRPYSLIVKLFVIVEVLEVLLVVVITFYG